MSVSAKKMEADVELAMDAIDKIVAPGVDYDSFAAEIFYGELIKRIEACQDGAACAHEYD